MQAIHEHLLDSYKQGTLIPFIGAGFSAAGGYPSTGEIIDSLLQRFHIQASEIHLDNNTSLPSIAEYLKILNSGDISPIVAEIAGHFTRSTDDAHALAPQRLLASLSCPVVYTTNYDALIERAFAYARKPYTVIVNTEDIINSAVQKCTHIVKYHGDFEQPSSMVLTESDYFTRLEYETPMDIKLRSNILGKSILFMGYSFSDFNIRYLWFKMRKMMQGVREQNIPKSFILLTEGNKMMATLLEHRGIIPLYLSDYPGASSSERLCSFLQTIR